MGIKGVFYVSIYSSDLERSKRFYGETLGWAIGTDEEGVAGFHFGAGYLVIQADNRNERDRSFFGGMHVEVQVEDVIFEHTRLKELDVKIGEIEKKPWGESNFNFKDPDGYLWSYGQA